MKPLSTTSPVSRDLLCFSHLRWNFVFQRPQHLLTRAARSFTVHFWEEPRVEAVAEPRLESCQVAPGIRVLVPVLPADSDPRTHDRMQQDLLEGYMARCCPAPVVAWYYTPMALGFTSHLDLPVCVYDCMDELSGFAGAPPQLRARERQLMKRADLVFTGGYSLYEAKRSLHSAAYPFPSSIDVEHFSPARSGDLRAPHEVALLDGPRIGYFGVIDERLDVDLVDELASLRPDWQIVMIGPVVKIDPAKLPKRDNIHWLGGKPYASLPAYLSAFDVGFMPFARNAATRYISPTKTPEFLAAGLPVVSTPIVDVVRSWGAEGLVEIADTAEATVDAIERLLARGPSPEWRACVDARLASSSWDQTWADMSKHVAAVARKRIVTRDTVEVRSIAQVSHV
ncbi:MAG: glycosyltransferase family 1 protein [Rhodospirillales bacterium]|nr:glycosyltransferase family 1 protein [Rhodospirillales bacterium]